MARISTQETYADFLQIGKKNKQLSTLLLEAAESEMKNNAHFETCINNLLRDVLVCSIAQCFYKLCCIQKNTKNETNACDMMKINVT